jgi:hypothetical protein
MIVTSRKVSEDVYHGGHRAGKNFLIERNAKPYVDRPLFENFIWHQLIPYINALRINPCYSKAEAVLLMDNCSVHVTPEIFRLLVVKMKEKFWMNEDDYNTFTATIHRLVRQFHSVATSENIRGSFVRAGFSYSTRAIPYLPELWRERMMESAGFRQDWALDIPLESLSMRRQRPQFGFVNETSFQSFDEKKSEFNRTTARKSCSTEFVYFHFFIR